ILPDLSAFATKKDWPSFNNVLLRAIKTITFITIPITFFALLFRENIIILIFQNNRFTAESVQLTKEAFTFHIMGLFFIALNRILSPAFYAQGNTKSPTMAGILGFLVNMTFAWSLVSPMKGGGIALAVSLASLANTAFLLVFLAQKKILDITILLKNIFLYVAKIVLISTISIIPLFFAKRHIMAFFAQYNRFIAHGIPLALCVTFYSVCGIGVLIILKDSIIQEVIKIIKRRR
ncbi:MAG: lipid II flippase MurJ, partial [Treponemataceae bacterium]